MYLSPKINVISVSGLWSKSKRISFSVKPIQHVQACTIASVVSDSLWPHGLWPTRLLRPWDSPGKNTGVSCHTLLQGIFLTQEIESTSLESPALEDRFFITSTTWEASNRHVSSSKSWLCQAYTENLVSLYIKHVSSRRQVVPRQSLLQILFEISRRNRKKITTTPWSYTQEMTWTHPNFKVPF